jgi:glutathione S-transferase
MTLFSDARCHYSHRVRIVLAEKGVAAELIDVDGRDYPPALAEINPYSSLPTLVDRELVLYQPGIMMEYLDERFPHPPLLPVYPVARGECRQLMYRLERDWSSRVDVIESPASPPQAVANGAARSRRRADGRSAGIRGNAVLHERGILAGRLLSLRNTLALAGAGHRPAQHPADQAAARLHDPDVRARCLPREPVRD